MSLNQVLEALSRNLTAGGLLTAPDDIKPYVSDWTKTAGTAMAVALPRSTAEVVSVVKACRDAKVPIVPSGGRTGLAGGAVGTPGCLVLSTTRLNRLGEVDIVGRSVYAEAGVVTQTLHEHVHAHDLEWPIDLAAKGSSTVGGNLSTNAGGVAVIRYGMTRKWVTGLQAVTIDGDVLELNGELEKNNTGYDLVQLLVGSEGTLAIITGATLKLTRRPRHLCTLLLAVRNFTAVPDLFVESRHLAYDIQAFEFFSNRCLTSVKEKLGRKCRLTVEAPFYVLIELEGEDAYRLQASVEEWVAPLMTQGLVLDGMIGSSSEERKEIWGLREGITESLALSGRVRKYDVSVPVRHAVEFIDDVKRTIDDQKPVFDLYLFGHLADGSPHLNLLKHPHASMEQFEADGERFEKVLYAILKSHGGSVSAEHGVGLLKKNWLTYSRSATELRLYRSIKHAFDPHNLLNPGKVVDV
jgi:FAD/FMN-containing dehydrogenase